MKIFLTFIAALLIFHTIAIAAPSAALAADNAKTLFDKSLKDTGNEIGYNKIEMGKKKLPEIIGLIIQGFLLLLGIIFLGLLIYGGYMWMTARGNEQDMEKAKAIIRNAIIGLIIILAAYAITAEIGFNIAAEAIPPTKLPKKP